MWHSSRMAWPWLTRILPCCSSPDDRSNTTRASTPLFGTSRPASYFSFMDNMTTDRSAPAYPPGLRPLRLVEMQQARRGAIPARGSSLRRDLSLRPPAPDAMPVRPPPAAEPHWPSPEEMARMSTWRSVDTLWEAPENIDEPARPFTPVIATASRRSVHYDVNDWLNKSRAARAQQQAAPPLPYAPLSRAQTAPPALVEPRASELPYLRPVSPTGSLPVPIKSPRPALRREPTDEEQHEMAIEALRAQGSWLPHLLQQARRGHVLTVPPNISAQGAARMAAAQQQKSRRPNPGRESASGPPGP